MRSDSIWSLAAMRAVPWRLSVKESSRRPAEGSLSPASAFAGSTPSRRIGAALPRMNGAPNRSGRISSGPLRPVGLQCGQSARAVVLLAPERQSVVGWPVGDAPAGFSVEPEAAGGRGRIGREKPLPGGGLFLLRCVIPGVVRILRPAIVLACAVEGELVPRRVAQRRRQARTCLDSLQEGLAAFEAAHHLQHRRAAGWAFVGALRQDAAKGPVRRPLRAVRIDAAPDAGNGALEGMKPDRCKAFFLLDRPSFAPRATSQR